MKPTYITEKSFRYRNNGVEGNRKVLVTAHNQNSLKGFDITGMPENKVTEIQKAWNKVQKRKCPLTTKEASVLNALPKTKFRSYKLSKVRYFHNS